MEKQLLNHAGLPPEVLTMRAPVGVPSQDTVVCFGRVCTDVSEGKLSMTSVMLEGGRMEGGQRVKLVLNELPSFALFPGQFIVVEVDDRIAFSDSSLTLSTRPNACSFLLTSLGHQLLWKPYGGAQTL